MDLMWGTPKPPKDTSGDSDPSPADRVWYENVQTGDRGWLVVRENRDVIRLDRGEAEEIRGFSEQEWKPVLTHRPLTLHAGAVIAFEADKALNRALGDHEKSRKEWPSLTQQKKRAWMMVGPQDPEIRAGLYKAIMGYLRPFME